MTYYALKIVLSAAIIVMVSELAKRSTLLAAVLASLPFTSLLAFIWIYLESGDVSKIAQLSTEIFWLVIPSLALFLLLPLCLKLRVGFSLSLLMTSAGTVLCYFGLLHDLEG
jgi:hypothetical protein